MRLVTSPGDGYAREIIAAFSDATSFAMVMGFATARGVAVVEPAVRAVLDRGGSGRVVLAVDRQRFNAAAVFEALLAIKASYGEKFCIGLVPEGAGLLHAKAVCTEGPRGTQLIVGSANLTSSALGANHELGVARGDLPQDQRRAFYQFMTTLGSRSLDGPDARVFLEKMGLLAQRPSPSAERRPPPRGDSIPDIVARLPAQAPFAMPAEDQLSRWISRGFMVGRGRRGLPALVLSLPQEALIKHGMLRTADTQPLGLSSHETRTMGYGINLLRTADAELLRKSVRRISLLLAKLTMTLPCFGLWMPESFWDAFVTARDKMASHRSSAKRKAMAAHIHGPIECKTAVAARRLGPRWSTRSRIRNVCIGCAAIVARRFATRPFRSCAASRTRTLSRSEPGSAELRPLSTVTVAASARSTAPPPAAASCARRRRWRHPLFAQFRQPRPTLRACEYGNRSVRAPAVADG